MFLLDWFYGVLAFLGLWQKEANILFLSDFYARRTTLISMLKNERLVQDQPTQYLLNAEEFRIGRIKFKAFDFGGLRISFRVLQDYHLRVDAVVYFVDAYDLEDWSFRWRDASFYPEEFLFNEAMRNLPLLLLFDKPDGAFEGYILPVIPLLLGSNISDWENEAPPRIKSGEVFECDIEHQMGYHDGFEWLSHQVMVA